MAKHPASIEGGEQTLADPTKGLSDQQVPDPLTEDRGGDLVVDDAPSVSGSLPADHSSEIS